MRRQHNEKKDHPRLVRTLVRMGSMAGSASEAD